MDLADRSIHSNTVEGYFSFKRRMSNTPKAKPGKKAAQSALAHEAVLTKVVTRERIPATLDTLHFSRVSRVDDA